MTTSLEPRRDACDSRPTYTIGTLVNDEAHFAAMRASFEARGFCEPACEFLAIHHPACGYAALNELLALARGRIVILCHQDVRLIGDGRAELDARLADLERRDPGWAVAGNAGGIAPGDLALRITDPHGRDRRIGELPARVMSLDENFLVVRADARIGFSRDLAGFHLYGADICLMASVAGCSAYVIDFHLEHLSPGRKDASFHAAEQAFSAKWARAMRPRWMQTTCTLMRLDGRPIGTWLGRLAAKPYGHLLRRRSRAGIWTRPRPGGRTLR
jgi:hypothetical protein